MFNEQITKLAKEILAMPMQVHDITPAEIRSVLAATKRQFNIDQDQKPIYSAYISAHEGTSNKYHLFTIFEKSGVFIASNAYGRIGYNPKYKLILQGKSYSSARDAVDRKMYTKTHRSTNPYSMVEENEDRRQLEALRAASKKQLQFR
jgi:hypothetical protein